MNHPLQLSKAPHKRGLGGTIATVLHRATRSLDSSNRTSRNSVAKTSEFLKWVRFAVPGMLRIGNIDQMDHAIANMPQGKHVVEIGSFCGLSTCVLSYLLDMHSPNSTLFTCDKWEFEGQQPGRLLGDSQVVTHDVYRTYVRNTFLRSMETFSAHRLPQTVECFSDEFFRRWFATETHEDVFGRQATLGGEIGFCYIDGNHTYEFARRDFENTDRALVPGGFVLFDDSSDRSHCELNGLVREISTGSQYELISRKPNYLFRKKLNPAEARQRTFHGL